MSLENITFSKNKNYPYIIFDNWYNKEEEKLVAKELEFWTLVHKNKLELPKKDAVARDRETDEPLGKHFRIYLKDYYSSNGTNLSPIWSCLYKQQEEKFHKIITDYSPMYNNFGATSDTSFFASYYDNSHYYKTHFDGSPFSCLIYFFKTPKNFIGGDLKFKNLEETIECKHNRMILFPGWMEHASTPLKLLDNDKQYTGKYTITHFYYGVV